MESSNSCAFCGARKAGLQTCTACRLVAYFDRDCQKAHWKEHKGECSYKPKEKKKATQGDGVSSPSPFTFGGLPPPSSWASGLSEDQRYEWLVDCYRMRADDDYAWGGGNMHGLYSAACDEGEEANLTIASDFLIFCRLAVRHEVVPSPWNWGKFLKKAAGMLGFAFEKEDAKEKWGGENVFSAMMGGRSLRATGEVVYGSSCMQGGISDDDDSEALCEEQDAVHEALEEVRNRFDEMIEKAEEEGISEKIEEDEMDEWKSLPDRLFDGVGGKTLWVKLYETVAVGTVNEERLEKWV
uniref:MYND-type domain-containing protein n=1 Tax=Chromera velia CCMP2878 TaxID=1169474 RepID=A0A0G4HLW5_9ALVE|eukprot:Cvel_7474.t1-p1 / transcript=Cvel_7474.t1 / gene=Cvel_7474 / organism=Chromera_velia_CCMP2878 / gene_product=hypothetical protein / transcript_product=hypothetical protein / location=Cvel_scaffold391:33178-34065(-) / protein_length=296 / sequence_SO=supercontig / SO=protein_coding / is_pseudo=false